MKSYTADTSKSLRVPSDGTSELIITSGGIADLQVVDAVLPEIPDESKASSLTIAGCRGYRVHINNQDALDEANRVIGENYLANGTIPRVILTLLLDDCLTSEKPTSATDLANRTGYARASVLSGIGTWKRTLISLIENAGYKLEYQSSEELQLKKVN